MKSHLLSAALFLAVSTSALGGEVIKGKVLETTDAAGYTYVKVKAKSGEVWAAVPVTKLSKGQDVEISSQMVMEKFHSTALNRDFNQLHFGTLGGAAAAPAPSQPKAPAQPPHGQGGMAVPDWALARPSGQASTVPAGAKAQPAAPKAPVKGDGKVRKIAEVYAQKASLVGKAVTVKGKVVKFTGGVMGKNWVHLQDGSGSAEAKNHDVTLTTQDVVTVGSEVTMTGVLATDKDVGSGYFFPVILEDAGVTQ